MAERSERRNHASGVGPDLHRGRRKRNRREVTRIISMRLSLSLAQRAFVPPRIAFLLCALTFSQLSSAQNDSMLAQGGDIYTKAMAAYQDADYSLAAQLFEQAEVETPGTTEALLYAGRSFVR